MKGKDDFKKFAELMVIMSEIFDSSKKPSAMKIEIYFQALKHLTIEEIEVSVSKIIKERVFSGLPKPADIIGYVPKQLGVMTSLEAWALALEWFEGGAQPIDAVINKAVNILGGYEKVSRTPYSQLPWFQKDFEKLYNDLTECREAYGLLETTKPLKIT